MYLTLFGVFLILLAVVVGSVVNDLKFPRVILVIRLLFYSGSTIVSVNIIYMLVRFIMNRISH